MREKTVLRILSVFFTGAGFLIFLYMVWVGGNLTEPLLMMILGELIDVPKQI